jgi:hypothetical protein
VKIRRATHADVDAAVVMACRFIAESSYRGELIPDPAHQLSVAQFLLEQGVLFVADAGSELVGLLGLVVVPSVISGELVATEVVWWVDPEWRHPRSSAGGRLLVTGEGWAMEVARDRGLPSILMQMIAPMGADGVTEIYKRRGYLPLETIHQKRLPAAA